MFVFFKLAFSRFLLETSLFFSFISFFLCHCNSPILQNIKNILLFISLHPNQIWMSLFVMLWVACLSERSLDSVQVYDVGLPDLLTGNVDWNLFIKVNILVVEISVMARLLKVELFVGSSNESWMKHRNNADATAETVENNLPCQQTSHNTTYTLRLPQVWKACNYLKYKPLPVKNLPLKLHHLLWDPWIMGRRYFSNLLAWGTAVFRLFGVRLCLQLSVPWDGKNLITNTRLFTHFLLGSL